MQRIGLASSLEPPLPGMEQTGNVRRAAALLLWAGVALVQSAPSDSTLPPTPTPTQEPMPPSKVDSSIVAGVVAGTIGSVMLILCFLWFVVRKVCAGVELGAGVGSGHGKDQNSGHSLSKSSNNYEVIRSPEAVTGTHTLAIDLDMSSAHSDHTTLGIASAGEDNTVPFTKKALARHNRQHNHALSTGTASASPLTSGSVGTNRLPFPSTSKAETGLLPPAPLPAPSSMDVWEPIYSEKYKKHCWRNVATGHVTFTDPSPAPMWSS